jgi:hypothetical protein
MKVSQETIENLEKVLKQNDLVKFASQTAGLQYIRRQK